MKRYIQGCWWLWCVAIFLIGATAQSQLIWSNGPAMSVHRMAHTATMLKDGRILLVGGEVAVDNATTSVEIYDPVSNTYQPTGSLNEPRNNHSATLLPDGRVLVIGGYANYQYLNSAEIYEPCSGTWSPTQPLFLHGVNHCAVLLKDGRVLVVAGDFQPGSDGSDDRVELFDPVMNTWSAGAYHEGIGDSATATLLNDGRVLFTRAYSAETDIYNPGSSGIGAWQSAGAMPISHGYGATSVLLSDGRVMIVGGWAVDNDLSHVDLYDPVSSTWSSSDPLHQQRALHTATVLPDGQVVVAGGVKRWDDWLTPDNYLHSTEIYNPATSQWEEGPAMNMNRGDHTASLLRDGRLFVAGGRNGSSDYLNNTEVLVNDGTQFEPLITRIGFSNDPEGDQDVTEFLTNETFYVSVKDVDLIATDPHCNLRVLLQGQGRGVGRWWRRYITVTQDLIPQPNGSFTGAIPLNQFCPGQVSVMLMGHDRSNYLFRKSSISIEPAQ